jgi:hypothetical protein
MKFLAGIAVASIALIGGGIALAWRGLLGRTF